MWCLLLAVVYFWKLSIKGPTKTQQYVRAPCQVQKNPSPCTSFSLAEYSYSWPPHRASAKAEMEEQPMLLHVAWQNTLGFDSLLAKPLRFARLSLPPTFKQQWNYPSTPSGLAAVAAGHGVCSSEEHPKLRIKRKSLVLEWKKGVLEDTPRNCFYKGRGVTNPWVMRPGTDLGHGGSMLELEQPKAMAVCWGETRQA